LRRQEKSAEHLRTLDIHAFSRDRQEAFVKMLHELIKEFGPQTLFEIQQEGAFELKLSTETVKRYVITHTARRAHFKFNDETDRIECRKCKTEPE
jgi:hypothetical protein